MSVELALGEVIGWALRYIGVVNVVLQEHVAVRGALAEVDYDLREEIGGYIYTGMYIERCTRG